MSDTYLIKEIFDTVQGEGSRAGARSVFVRMAGCNLWNGLASGRDKGKGACARWCDSDFNGGEKLTAAQVISRMDALWPAKAGEDRWCVLTGGEPMLQVDMPLLKALGEAGWQVAVETNGTVNPKVHGKHVSVEVLEAVQHVTLSPKLGGAVVIGSCTDLKVVLPGAVGDEQGWKDEDLLRMADEIGHEHLFVQPQDIAEQDTVGLTYLGGDVPHASSDYTSSVQQCIRFVMNHPEWKLGYQLHKVWELK